MCTGLTEGQWDYLLSRIQMGNCTPFLGAGVNIPHLSTGSVVASDWVQRSESRYPLRDERDLAEVAQYLAIEVGDVLAPKVRIAAQLDRERRALQTSDEDLKGLLGSSHPLAVLARLPFPIYMTTNYDDLMSLALKACGKSPTSEICPWNKYLNVESVFSRPEGFEPTSEEPLVYHLHGSSENKNSLVLTESDYLDFIINVKRDQILPPRIEEALAGQLLFLGYSLSDWSFRVLLRGVVESLGPSQKRASIAVQLPLESENPQAQDFLERYFGEIGNVTVRVYWGDIGDFAADLDERWKEYDG